MKKTLNQYQEGMSSIFPSKQYLFQIKTDGERKTLDFIWPMSIFRSFVISSAHCEHKPDEFSQITN